MAATFEFLGGFMDGRTVSTDATDLNETQWAESYYFLTTAAGLADDCRCSLRRREYLSLGVVATRLMTANRRQPSSLDDS
jgi:hypothetical protein